MIRSNNRKFYFANAFISIFHTLESIYLRKYALETLVNFEDCFEEIFAQNLTKFKNILKQKIDRKS